MKGEQGERGEVGPTGKIGPQGDGLVPVLAFVIFMVAVTAVLRDAVQPIEHPSHSALIEVGHAIIGAAYVMLAAGSMAVGFIVRPLDPTWRNLTLAIGGLLFFTGCAAHHVDMLVHSAANTPLDARATHHVLPTISQVIGAPAVLFALRPYLAQWLGRR